jgi:hypothetical protein
MLNCNAELVSASGLIITIFVIDNSSFATSLSIRLFTRSRNKFGIRPCNAELVSASGLIITVFAIVTHHLLLFYHSVYLPDH